MKDPVQTVWCRSFPSAELIGKLLDEMRKLRVSFLTQQFIGIRAGLQPKLRLAVNLKMFLSILSQHDVDHVIPDGLSDREKKVLSELDSAGLSVELRETAHGLLNIHERWKLQRALAGAFRQADSARADCVGQVGKALLDNILGGSNQGEVQ